MSEKLRYCGSNKEILMINFHVNIEGGCNVLTGEQYRNQIFSLIFFSTILDDWTKTVTKLDTKFKSQKGPFFDAIQVQANWLTEGFVQYFSFKLKRDRKLPPC